VKCTLRMSSIFDGPVELVKTIFDIAAREEKSTALQLVRVCKAARQWVVPIIYETVELDNPSALRFERMLAMPSSYSLASLVRNLRVTCLPDVDLLSSRCGEVEAMTIANYDIHHLGRLKLPSLKHLTIRGSLQYAHFSSNMPALATVTHLRFQNDVPRLPEDFSSSIPSLTHFSCCYHLSKKSQHRELERCLNTMMAAPALRTAIVCVHTRDQDPGDSISHVLGVCDPRVVVVSSVQLANETQHQSPTQDTCGIVAEEFKKQCRM
jgi:hypothetical protein